MPAIAFKAADKKLEREMLLDISGECRWRIVMLSAVNSTLCRRENIPVAARVYTLLDYPDVL